LEHARSVSWPAGLLINGGGFGRLGLSASGRIGSIITQMLEDSDAFGMIWLFEHAGAFGGMSKGPRDVARRRSAAISLPGARRGETPLPRAGRPRWERTSGRDDQRQDGRRRAPVTGSVPTSQSCT